MKRLEKERQRVKSERKTKISIETKKEIELQRELLSEGLNYIDKRLKNIKKNCFSD